MARGARMVEYWHWHSIHFGHEAYWLGVLNHDGEPGRCYDEVKRIAGELQPRRRRRWPTSCPTPTSACCTRARASGRWSSIRRSAGRGRPRARPRLLRPHLRALLRGPVRRRPAGRRRLRAAARQRRRRARGALAGARRPRALRRRRRAAGPCSTPTRGRAGTSCSASAAATPTRRRARAPEVMPGRLREAVGASYGEYTNLAAPGAAARRTRASTCPAGAAATAWADALVPEGAETLVRLRRIRTSGAGRRSPPTRTARAA